MTADATNDGGAYADAHADGAMENAGDAAPSADADTNRYCVPTGEAPSSGKRHPELRAAPGLKWQRKLTDNIGGTARSIVISRQAVAVTVTNSLSVINKSSGAVSTFFGGATEVFGAAIVAQEDLFVVAARNVYAVDVEGKLKWNVPLEAGPAIDEETSRCNITFSRRRSVLVAACNDGAMYGVHVADRGELRWLSRVYSKGPFGVLFLPSFGDVALVDFSAGTRPDAIRAIEPDTGRIVGNFNTMGDAIWSLSSRGFLARTPPTSSLAGLDNCGRRQWITPQAAGFLVPMVVGLPDDRIFVLERRSEGDIWRLGLISSVDGTRLAGPTGGGTPIAAGADGTFYAVTCDNAAPGTIRTPAPPDLVAYSEELQEKWRVSLPVPALNGGYACPKAGAALDEDGVLYLVAEADGTYVLAVQTTSPGVADTPWPLRYGRPNGIAWVE